MEVSTMKKQHLVNHSNGKCFCGNKGINGRNIAFIEDSILYTYDARIIDQSNYKQLICINCLKKSNPDMIIEFERLNNLERIQSEIPKSIAGKRLKNSVNRRQWGNQRKKRNGNVIELPYVPMIMGLIEYKPVIEDSIKPNKPSESIKPKSIYSNEESIIELVDEVVINPDKNYEIIEFKSGNDELIVVSIHNQAQILIKTIDKNGKVINEPLTDWIDRNEALDEVDKLIAA
jgi:hypothetical protein